MIQKFLIVGAVFIGLSVAASLATMVGMSSRPNGDVAVRLFGAHR